MDIEKIDIPKSAKETNYLQKKRKFGTFSRSKENINENIKDADIKTEKYAEDKNAEIILEDNLPKNIQEELDNYRGFYNNPESNGQIEIEKVEKINYGDEKEITKYKITSKISHIGTLMSDGSGQRHHIPDKPLEITIKTDKNNNIIKRTDNSGLAKPVEASEKWKNFYKNLRTNKESGS